MEEGAKGQQRQPAPTAAIEAPQMERQGVDHLPRAGQQAFRQHGGGDEREPGVPPEDQHQRFDQRQVAHVQAGVAPAGHPQHLGVVGFVQAEEHPPKGQRGQSGAAVPVNQRQQQERVQPVKGNQHHQTPEMEKGEHIGAGEHFGEENRKGREQQPEEVFVTFIGNVHAGFPVKGGIAEGIIWQMVTGCTES